MIKIRKTQDRVLMHRGLPCSDETANSGSKIPTFGPKPTEDSSSSETCSPTSTSSKAETTRAYNMFQHDAVINMMLDDDIPQFTTRVQLSFSVQL
jgi:SET domain-containing protein